ncbi:MAG: hypothetical protein ACQEQV_03070 [Fibrobacterota bacterium]
MDNIAQIEEIRKYRLFLSKFQNRYVDINTAALLWIKRYAKGWREMHRTSL